jgi:type 1 glutamine amidotransferase/sugar phosphate isomerase/epimerase
MRAPVILVLIGSVAMTGSLLERRVHTQAPAPNDTQKLAFVRSPDALERVTYRTRTMVNDDRLTNWNFAIATGGPGYMSFLDTVQRADAAVVDFVEGSSGQTVGRDVEKPFGPGLSAAEIAAIRARMTAPPANVRMLTYRVERLASDTAARRQLFEFVKAMGGDTLVVPSNTVLEGLDALADEFAINVAVLGDAARPVRTMKALEAHGSRIGVGIDTAMLAREGVSPKDALAVVKDRLKYVFLQDRSQRGPASQNVPLGKGVVNMTEFFFELNRLKVRPLAMTLGPVPGELFKAIDAFEASVQPAYGAYFNEFSKTRPIRWDVVMPGKGETLPPDVLKARTDEVTRQIEAAIPKQAYAKPKKPRKLLVIESLQGMSHNTIPHTNVMLQRMGEITGAWQAVFDNNLENLRYPKIKEYDAIFLNSIVNEFLPDPELREGFARYVREGGGLGGVHGSPWASRNWEELAEMLGSQSAPHRIEQGVMRVYDPASPIMKPFDGQALNFREEYYRFKHEGMDRVRWDKVRVLLTVDLDDPKIEPRPWAGYKRPDNTYPVTWIRSYGKGRVFYCSLGHMAETFMSPPIVGHFLAGIQFMLGDLEADTTPNPPTGRSKSQ